MAITPITQQPHRDNLLGICNAIGEAFGFDPLYLRIAFIIGMLANFTIALIVYLVCGAAVMAAICVDRAAARMGHLTPAA